MGVVVAWPGGVFPLGVVVAWPGGVFLLGVVVAWPGGVFLLGVVVSWPWGVFHLRSSACGLAHGVCCLTRFLFPLHREQTEQPRIWHLD